MNKGKNRQRLATVILYDIALVNILLGSYLQTEFFYGITAVVLILAHFAVVKD